MPYFQSKKVGDLPPGNFGKRRIQGAERLSQEKMRLHKHRSLNKWRILELSMSETWLALRWFLQPPWWLWGHSKTRGTPNGNSSRSQLHFTSQLHQTSFGGLFQLFPEGRDASIRRGTLRIITWPLASTATTTMSSTPSVAVLLPKWPHICWTPIIPLEPPFLVPLVEGHFPLDWHSIQQTLSSLVWGEQGLLIFLYPVLIFSSPVSFVGELISHIGPGPDW